MVTRGGGLSGSSSLKCSIMGFADREALSTVLLASDMAYSLKAGNARSLDLDIGTNWNSDNHSKHPKMVRPRIKNVKSSAGG